MSASLISVSVKTSKKVNDVVDDTLLHVPLLPIIIA